MSAEVILHGLHKGYSYIGRMNCTHSSCNDWFASSPRSLFLLSLRFLLSLPAVSPGPELPRDLEPILDASALLWPLPGPDELPLRFSPTLTLDNQVNASTLAVTNLLPAFPLVILLYETVTGCLEVRDRECGVEDATNFSRGGAPARTSARIER